MAEMVAKGWVRQKMPLLIYQKTLNRNLSDLPLLISRPKIY